MKKHQLIFWVSVVVLCFAVLFYSASKKVQKRNEEVAAIHHAAEAAIGDYLKGETITAVSFNSLPIYFDKDRGIIGCRVLSVKNGAEKRTGFGILLRREKTIWKAAIAEIIKNPPIPAKKNHAILNSLSKPAQEGR